MVCKVYRSGERDWYDKNGRLHRSSGPAVIYHYNIFWYKHGRSHRVDGPAIIYNNGDKYWYQNDQLHRLDGPAVEYATGYAYYWINGEKLTKQEWKKHYGMSHS